MRDLIVPELGWPLDYVEDRLCLDLVEIELACFQLEGDPVAAMVAMSSLHEMEVSTVDGRTVPLFNRPKRRRAGHPLKVGIRSAASGSDRIAPILSGRLVAVETTSWSNDHIGLRPCVKVKVYAHFNVARFLAAQRYRRFRTAPHVRPRMPFALAGSRHPQVYGDEVAFGGDGNVLMGSPALYAYAASKSSILHLIDLLTGFLSGVEQWVRERVSGSEVEIVSHPRFALKRVEYHIETHCLNPRARIREFFPSLLRQGQIGNVYKRMLTGQVRQFGPYSLGVQIQLLEGVKLTTYAKTNRRIRFEVKYSGLGISGRVGRRTDLMMAQLSDVLRDVRHHAWDQLQRILLEVVQSAMPLQEVYSPYDLCREIGVAADTSEVAEELFQSLCHTGRIVVPQNSILRSAVNNLTKSGVLRFTSYALYSVSDEYEFALRTLMKEHGVGL